MSCSFADVRPQYDHIRVLLSEVSGATQAQVSNKGVVIRCDTPATATATRQLLKSKGFFSDMAEGLISKAIYLKAYFNNPY